MQLQFILLIEAYPTSPYFLRFYYGMRSCRSNCLGFVCFVVINLCVLSSANRVDVGFFVSKIFQYYSPHPHHHFTPSVCDFGFFVPELFQFFCQFPSFYSSSVCGTCGTPGEIEEANLPAESTGVPIHNGRNQLRFPAYLATHSPSGGGVWLRYY